MVGRGSGPAVSEADLAAFRADVAQETRPGAEAAIEQVGPKHPHVLQQSPDRTDDYYVLVGVTWARLRDFDPVPDPTATVETRRRIRRSRGRCSRHSFSASRPVGSAGDVGLPIRQAALERVDGDLRVRPDHAPVDSERCGLPRVLRHPARCAHALDPSGSPRSAVQRGSGRRHS